MLYLTRLAYLSVFLLLCIVQNLLTTINPTST